MEYRSTYRNCVKWLYSIKYGLLVVNYSTSFLLSFFGSIVFQIYFLQRFVHSQVKSFYLKIFIPVFSVIYQ